jgi:sugar (pentulose or hexulose) kinase
MLAGLGVGIYPDAESAIAAACRPDPPIQPDLANHDRYEAVYQRYRSVVASAALHAVASSTERPAGERA